MKRQRVIWMLVVGLVLAASNRVWANGTPIPETVTEGVELSGNITTLVGWQHDDKDAFGAALGGMGDVLGVGNSDTGATFPNADHFRFVVDQAELDLQKKFGENIRLRADLDFGDFGNTGNRAGNGTSVNDFFDLEQAYVTANIAWGNGVEFLIGKFNAPVGVESVDRNENWLISYASPFRFFTPTNITGAKIYYAFSDLVDLHLYVVNDLNSNGFAFDSAIPSVGFRLGFNWGAEDKKNTVGISGGAGPENSNAFGVSHNAHWDFFGDLDLMIALSDSVTLAAEGVYRQTDSITPGRNQKGMGGFVALNYQVNDAWDLTFRGDAAWDINPAPGKGGIINTGTGASTTGANWIGFEGTLISGAIGAGYKITDGAKMKLEYRFDWARTAGPAFDSDYHSVMAEFAYTF